MPHLAMAVRGPLSYRDAVDARRASILATAALVLWLGGCETTREIWGTETVRT
jgi:hypothetical protein